MLNQGHSTGFDSSVGHLEGVRTKQLRALDLFCCAGGASKGLQRAGFHVTGVDIRPQPRYCGDVFIEADAMTFPLIGFDFIWASPPCQRYTVLAYRHGNAETHPDLIAPVRERLQESGALWVIENVRNAAPELQWPIVLCGTMFGLGIPGAQLWRHRLFEANFEIGLVPPCSHWTAPAVGGDEPRRGVITVTGHTGGLRSRGNLKQYTVADRRAAMGIDWMTNEELAEAIPPAYSQFIGKHAARALQTNIPYGLPRESRGGIEARPSSLG